MPDFIWATGPKHYAVAFREIPIDSVVTADRRRVAHLSYSLHADVCSIVQPIESWRSTFDRRRPG
nr:MULTISPECIES: hypothetical protein [Halolamina]